MGSETCLKSSSKWCSLTFRGKNYCIGAEFEGPPCLLGKLGLFSRFPRSSWAFWVLMGPKRTPNDQVMTVLVNTGPLYGDLQRTSFSCDAFWGAAPKFCVLHSGDIVSTYILTDARNALWLSHTYVTACHTAKTRRIRLIVALFSWIYNQWDSPDHRPRAECNVCPYQAD